MQAEECSRHIRAICAYTGVPASLLPSKKELVEMRKRRDIEILTKEAEFPSSQIADNGFIFIALCCAWRLMILRGLGPFQVYSEVPLEPALPTSPEMLSNLTDEKRCARISRILMKKGIAQSLLQPLAMHLMMMIVSS
ncbi:hypothetical protein CDAR_111911 [Caerostris darwini]|uniref:Uncharacterized protein n=1 Tax=Caerostris darwini TaxID=1538125 RepID=A0AAV4PQ51_9ARAC|nr:hypothetical protein CDAR_111911 [Caerostris darwini]